jgi:WD40 repeat protein
VVHGDTLLSCSYDRTVKVWSTDTLACDRTLGDHDNETHCLLIHGDKLLSGADNEAIKVWSTDTWACERTVK